MRAGLIPSRSLQEKRILLVRTNNPENHGTLFQEIVITTVAIQQQKKMEIEVFT